MLANHQNTKNHLYKEHGFSIIELIIVVLIISIMSVFALMSFKGEKKYLADSQAYRMIDILHEARQRALTQHETMRVEISRTRNTIRLIAEREPGDTSDDRVIKTLTLQDPKDVVVGAAPANLSASPVEMSPIPLLSFKKSIHPLSADESVATLRFLRTGKVVDAGSNATGDNAVVTGATIYVWMPDYSEDEQPLTTGSVIRAITLQGAAGSSRYLKCPVVEGQCENWLY